MSTTVEDEVNLYHPNSPISPEESMLRAKTSSLSVLLNAVERGKAYQSGAFDSLYQALAFQAEELEVFRVLEIYIRRGTITDEKMVELMGRLVEGRDKLKAKLEAGRSS